MLADLTGGVLAPCDLLGSLLQAGLLLVLAGGLAVKPVSEQLFVRICARSASCSCRPMQAGSPLGPL
jgi:hypothetical protein